MSTFRVAEKFTEDLGFRYYEDGPFSGEQFLKEHLTQMVREAIDSGTVLHVNFDGVQGTPTSFLSEAFGGLKRDNPQWSADTLARHVIIEAPRTMALWPYLALARHSMRTGIAPKEKLRRK